MYIKYITYVYNFGYPHMRWIKTSHLLKNLINNERIKKNIN